MQHRSRRYLRISLVLFGIVLILAALEIILGNTIYSPARLFEILFVNPDAKGGFTIWTLRMPRMLCGFLTGMAFGMSGNTFQKLLGNPLASPDMIGITAGSSVTAVFAILVLHLSGTVVFILSLVGGLLVAGGIYALSLQHGYSSGRLILVGIGMQAFLGSIISWILLKASEFDVGSALRWLSGSLNQTKLEQVPMLATVVLLAGCVLLGLERRLEMLQLGSELPVTLGSAPERTRIALVVCALFLSAFATAVTGPIASVAFLSGPIAERIVRNGRGNVLVSGLMGAVLVLAADLVGQYLLPARYPVGVVTGVLGAPYLILLLIEMNRKGR